MLDSSKYFRASGRMNFLAMLILALAVSSCATPASESVIVERPAFAVLQPIERPQGVWTPESIAAATTWHEWEARIRQMADVRVGSSAGVPVGGPGGQAVRLHWRAYQHRQETRGAVIISVGFTEGLTLYQEVIHDLVANGYSVYVQDHRGQGFSTRLTGGTVGHVNRFEYLVDDLQAYIESVARERGPRAKPLYGLAHSMGGAVLAGVLERQGAASPLTAVALFTPMFEPATVPPGSRGLLESALQGWCHRGALDVRLPAFMATRHAGGESFESERDAFLSSPNPERNSMTHSVPRLVQRWRAREAQCDAGEHCGNGDARVAGPTLQWAMQACHASAQARGADAGRVARPVLLFNGGQDTIVLGAAQSEFCRQVNMNRPGACTGWTLPGSRHGLLVETDEWRQLALGRMLAFFETQAAASSKSQ
jgi:lysophospholipase